MAKYRYTMKITAEKLADIIEAAILAQSGVARRPDELGQSGLHTFSFTFHDEDITQAERLASLNALPEWLRMVYSFQREVLPDDEV